jgi:hypothetical protein
MRIRIAILLVASAMRLCAQDAEAVLNRYVRVTGGADLYKRYNALHLFYTVTHADKSTENVDYFHTRDGRTLIETDMGNATRDEGVSEGIAWKYSEAKGAHLLSGKEAERLIAESRGFDEDDWQTRYRSVGMLDNQLVNGAPCRHLKLVRTDGSTLERFYEVQSGLLVREIATEFDAAGVERPRVTDFQRYDDFLGLRRPVSMRVKSGSETLTIQMNSFTYSPNAEASNFELPHDVVRAIVASRTKNGSLPNPVDLIDKFVAATGGKGAYQGIKTEVVKAEVSFTAENLKFPVVGYSAGVRQYSSSDIPSLGKFESGDDGHTGWERSVVMGPRLRPHSVASDFTGPQPEEVLLWADSAVDMETVSQEQVNGAACYLVRMGAKTENATTSCFDVKTGFLLKTTARDVDGVGEQIYGDYRSENGIVICHHIDTKVAGHVASVQIKEIAINGPLPAGIFDLPPDVQALKAKRDAAAQAGPPAAPGAPTLKRPRPQ